MTTRRDVMRLGLLAPLAALPVPTGTAALEPPDPDLVEEMARYAEYLARFDAETRFAVEGNRCVFSGAGWTAAIARDAAGLTVRLDGVRFEGDEEQLWFVTLLGGMLQQHLRRGSA